jgi:hypothetical protein
MPDPGHQGGQVKGLSETLPAKSGLGDKPGLECLDGHPLALDLTGRQLDPNVLQVRSEHTFGLFHELEADPSAFLALTFVNDAAALDGAFTGNDANAGHV